MEASKTDERGRIVIKMPCSRALLSFVNCFIPHAGAGSRRQTIFAVPRQRAQPLKALEALKAILEGKRGCCQVDRVAFKITCDVTFEASSRSEGGSYKKRQKLEASTGGVAVLKGVLGLLLESRATWFVPVDRG